MKIILFCVSVLFLFSSCNQQEVRSETKPVVLDTVAVFKEKEPLKITYHRDSLHNKDALMAFKQKYTPAQMHIIGALNRIDTNRIRVGSIITVPDTLLTDFMTYSPFPEKLELADSIKNKDKLILIAKRLQLFAAYENGKMVRFGPVSTGKKSTQTPSGLYYTNYKAKLKISTVDGSWKMPWYFNISNRGGIGLHEYAMPGYPASHSCIRLYRDDAIWIYNWAKAWILTSDGQTIVQRGTPVIIFGEYDFAATAPWKEAVEQSEILNITEEEWQAFRDKCLHIQP